ncbi:FAD-dependent oxidoreductase [Paenibacillus albiflavus]|uniref:FAD-dependent oxidoreductase n=2 Tax=Paenibacillus albiflavus TaxID=2545760 RepID=A0A4R4EHX1_9BACL|nr:FAD-dependent oxidoreductase [Paenibacillus albiflavus]TCZ78953.1 FAD-dependent oxidoreductase [Paenibacillus albiflavus]
MSSKQTADVIVLGGGLGGCMAALAVAKTGYNVVMTEETDWLGGQLTTQAVPPDEHRWIESFGCTATYREFRDRVRAYYQTNYPMKEQAAKDPILNPGNGWVSRLCHEPKVALRVIEDMLAPYLNSGRITVMYNVRAIGAETEGDYVKSVTVQDCASSETHTLTGTYYIDATECGDILPLAGVEHVMGAESKDETGEPHALDVADPYDMQGFTHVFALDYVPDGDFTIPKPEQYDFWRQHVPNNTKLPLFSWFSNDADNMDKLKEFCLFPDERGLMSLWTYRRIIDPALFEDGLYASDISLINWAQNDYNRGIIYGVSEEERQKHLEGARQLSLSLVYWLQTETPRPDGGKGYPGLRLRKDVMGTEDGLAKSPYIRESRRIKAVYTIAEKDVSKEIRAEAGICRYEDSVGVGSYHLDLHATTVSERSFYIPNYPYEIPLGSLLPIRVKNLIPGCKNIGTTQITNGCYRLHPTEWNIGESAGYLAAYAIKNGITPHDVRAQEGHLKSFQKLIEQQGVEIHWPDDMEM